MKAEMCFSSRRMAAGAGISEDRAYEFSYVYTADVPEDAVQLIEY